MPGVRTAVAFAMVLASRARNLLHCLLASYEEKEAGSQALPKLRPGIFTYQEQQNLL
jgi:hypothetical protein